ncbi:type II toxin-antitoxin system VapC family toxin [Ancylobacter sp. WKF20]|uniref:type II toxin-antitoxin system VapC family toxin n=1 Tax=Ancylobacter sp. WKF20 TaxID=3039801 RepID=UPI002434220C|nr:type II toxin-antitoxin system VapC family toxin [Ancylobacter sp. WKF20]WGD30565.1 type II toxin-antitoxin system VapC family toxin [Ancylobacter sp. WKF20]
MAARYLLDTNIIIALRRRRPSSLVERLSRLQPGEVVMSAVVYGELCYGAEKSVRRDEAQEVLQRLTQAIPVDPLPGDAPLVYGRVRAALEARGAIIGGNDLWIAAHALARGLVLVTGNVREFGRVPDLVVEDWSVD